jgi:hypothetical protein
MSHDVFTPGPRQRLLLALLLAWSCCLALRAVAAGSTPARPEILERFLARDEPPVTSYKALRRLEARNDRYRKFGWMEVMTSLDPAEGFRYEIVAEGGSGYVRDRVLRTTLEREAQAWRTGESGRARLTESNYTFAAGDLQSELVRVSLIPRRADQFLVRGSIFLTREGADLVRIEGELAKNPSFWTRKVHIVRRYGRIADVRVPLSIESTAHVVVAGVSTFSMTYRYEELNGRAVAAEPAGVQQAR